MSAGAKIALLGALALGLTVASLCFGPAAVGPLDSLRALVSDANPALQLVLWEIRLPRAILGLMIGASLGLAGAAIQGFLRNPLAEPGLIGVSSSAALGAVVALQTGLGAAVGLSVPLLALGGALLAGIVLLGLAGPRGGSLSLILSGIALSSMAGALTSLVLNLSPNPYAAAEIVFWMLGSLTDRSFEHVRLILPFTLAGWLLLALLARSLDALTLGEDAAETLGVRLGTARILLVAGVALSVGAGVAVAGAIGFVGLVVPHLLRAWIGAMPSRLCLASAFGGAAMIQAADIAVRVIVPSRDLKLGVVTALVGAPIFLHLIYTTRREGL